MMRHYIVTALRNMAANKLQLTIAIFGLAIGLTAAIMAGAVTVDAFSHDHFIPGYGQIYYAVLETHNDIGDLYRTGTPRDLAAYLRDFPEVDAVARETGDYTPAVLSHGAFQARERFGWADPEFFRIERAPALYGDLNTALDRPDGAVVTLAMARKYFGRDNVVGETLELSHVHALTIRAVIADWPPNASNEKTTIFGSSLAPYSRMSANPGVPHMIPGGMQIDGITLIRLARGASVDTLNQRASDFLSHFMHPSPPNHVAMHFERADALNMSENLHPGERAQLIVMEGIALVILVLSCVNFVSLSVARSAQRGGEVAIRKVFGAARRSLIVQFLCESVLQVLFALCIATAIVEWSVPPVNAFLEFGAMFDYWRDPSLFAVMLFGALAVGLLAGFCPALVLSSFKPAVVLKKDRSASTTGLSLRQILVALQFAALVVFLISAETVFRQNHYVTKEAMGVDIGKTLIIHIPKCNHILRDRLTALPGVSGAACSSVYALPGPTWSEGAIPLAGGQTIDTAMVPLDVGYLELYGLAPIAGRFFRSAVSDAVPINPSSAQQVHYVVNQEAVRRLGYASAQAAVGQQLNFKATGSAAAMSGNPQNVSRFNGVIIGVVKDFSFTPDIAATMPGAKGIPPMAYSIGLPTNIAFPAVLHIRLSGQNIPQTLTSIDDVWKNSGELDPIDRQFLDAFVQDQESAVLKQGEAFAVFAAIAMVLACLGLFGVSQSAASRRTKEIGLRKAMGARNREVLGLLLWQFAKPVLVANLIAWPLAWWAMNRWLSGFAYHVNLNLWMFPAAGFAALLIALATVASQAMLVAWQKPVLALRYE